MTLLALASLSGCTSSSSGALVSPAATSVVTSSAAVAASPAAASTPSKVPSSAASTGAPSPVMDASAPPTSSSAPPSSAARATVTDAASLATAMTCTGYKPGDGPAPGVLDWGTCTWHGRSSQLYHFDGARGWAAFVKAVAAYGVTSGQVPRVGDFGATMKGGSDQRPVDAALAAALS